MQSSLSIMLGAVSRVRLQISMRIVPLGILSRIVRFYCVTIRTKRRTYLCGEMVESLVLELLQIKGVTNHIHVHIGYADEMVRSTGGSKKA